MFLHLVLFLIRGMFKKNFSKTLVWYFFGIQEASKKKMCRNSWECLKKIIGSCLFFLLKFLPFFHRNSLISTIFSKILNEWIYTYKFYSSRARSFSRFFAFICVAKILHHSVSKKYIYYTYYPPGGQVKKKLSQISTASFCLPYLPARKK